MCQPLLPYGHIVHQCSASEVANQEAIALANDDAMVARNRMIRDYKMIPFVLSDGERVIGNRVTRSLLPA